MSKDLKPVMVHWLDLASVKECQRVLLSIPPVKGDSAPRFFTLPYGPQQGMIDEAIFSMEPADRDCFCIRDDHPKAGTICYEKLRPTKADPRCL